MVTVGRLPRHKKLEFSQFGVILRACRCRSLKSAASENAIQCWKRHLSSLQLSIVASPNRPSSSFRLANAPA
jgi:hypothetical protein